MEVWAQHYGSAAQFLCVCVESKQVALAFSRMFRLNHAVNAYIPGRDYMPVGYGQLGCSGFIVSDANGRFVSRRTAAFLDYGEQAFRQLEQILAKELSVKYQTNKQAAAGGKLHPDYPYAEGNEAILDGIKKDPSLNGKKVVIQSFDTASGRFHVLLKDDNRGLSVLPCSLAPGDSAQSEANSNDDSAITSLQVPPSVGVDSMDKEHLACTMVLNELLSDPSMDNLKAAISVLDDHFLHEEELMKQAGFGGDPQSDFSAIASHTKDHQRILNLGRQVLDSCSADC